MWSNYHTHTSYCDGKSSVQDVVNSAGNLISLGFSSHAPLPFDCPWCMKGDELDEYLNEIYLLKLHNTSPEIYAGLEIDFIPDVIGVDQFQSRLDYTIGAVHFVERRTNGDPWEIDGPHSNFLEGLKEIFYDNIKEVIHRYFELIRLMVDRSQPTIVAHLDKIKIQNSDNKFFSEKDTWYSAIVTKTLDHIATNGSIIEVNTRGLYQNKTSTPYPSPWILEHIQMKKIPVTISSDAHHPDDLTRCFSETADLLYRTGFREIYILLNNKWQAKKFNTDGIIL